MSMFYHLVKAWKGRTDTDFLLYSMDYPKTFGIQNSVGERVDIKTLRLDELAEFHVKEIMPNLNWPKSQMFIMMENPDYLIRLPTSVYEAFRLDYDHPASNVRNPQVQALFKAVDDAYLALYKKEMN